MSKKRWLASFFALALATQAAWAQTVDEDVVPGQELPFSPVDALPPPARTTTTTEQNWVQTLVEGCLKSVVTSWAQGTCPNCPVVKAITVDPFSNAARQLRMVVQFTNNEKCASSQAMSPPPPPICANAEMPPCCGGGCGYGGFFGSEQPLPPFPPIFVPGHGWEVAFPGQVNASCQRATADKPGCCGNCGCKSCGKSATNAEVPWAMQMPPFALQYQQMCQMPGYPMGPVMQHAPFAHPSMNPWMAQQWMPPMMMPPAWGQNVDWANAPVPPGAMFGAGVNASSGVMGSIVLNERNFDVCRAPTTWLEWNHPVVWTRVEEPSQAIYQVVAKGDAVYLNTPNLEAKCQRMTYVGNRDKVILEGDVRLVSKKGTDVTRIEAPRILVDLLQSTFTVEAGKGNAPISAAPCCPGACPVMPIGPVGTWGQFWERMCGYGEECEMPREAPQRNLPAPVPTSRSDR